MAWREWIVVAAVVVCHSLFTPTTTTTATITTKDDGQSSSNDHTYNTRDGPNSKAPPDFTTTLKTSYTMTLEVSSPLKNQSFYVTEVHERMMYHGMNTDTQAVTIWANGTSYTYQYYPMQDVMVREYMGECAEMQNEPNIAWGWMDKVPSHGPKSFGPSSILRLINYVNTEYVENVEPEEGVKVEAWKAYAGNSQEITLLYYYSSPEWSMPDSNWFEGQSGGLPVRMEVTFKDGFEHFIYTFVEFLPFVASHNMLEPPRGMSCEGLAGVIIDDPVPTMPKHFSVAQENILNSLIDGRDFGTQHMDKIQLTYASEISLVSILASLPYNNEFSTSYAIKIIHDFNTGIQYTIFKEFGNCSKDPIPPFTFDAHYGGFLGTGDSLLSPNDLFHLDDKFAFVGERVSRDIPGELWTSTRDDIPDPVTGGIENFKKAVLEYYFSKGVERNPEGEFVDTNLPFRNDLFIYNKSNPQQIITTTTTNYYDFRVMDIFSPDEFSVEECYEKYDDNWSYLDIFFPVSQKNQILAASEEQTRFKHEVMAKLIEIGRLSPVRIASIDVDTGISGLIPNTSDVDTIITKIKLLERAPYIYSYRQPPDELNAKPGKNEKLYPSIRRRDDCATICATTTEMDCIAFHHCGSDCYLSKLSGADGDILDVEGSCEHWVYDLQNKTLEDYPSQVVYKSVFNAIRSGKFHFSVPFRNNTSGVGFEAKMSLHYRTPDPLDPVRMQFTLEQTMMSVAHPNDTIPVGDLTECLLLCVSWVRYRCETAIHQVQEGLCLLVETHYHDIPHTELIPHSESFVHGRSYLVDYSPILGGVALNTTGPSYYPVEHLEACARFCNMEKSIVCRSFEWCPSNQICHLHAEHFLDVVDSGDYETGTACIHFSSKVDSIFTKYEDQGLEPGKHKLAAHMSSPSACAKMCVEDTNEVCQSYDFCSICDKNNIGVCGEENKGKIGLCFLATHHLGEQGLKLTTGKLCDHYDREMFGNVDYPSWVSKNRISEKPYRPGDMAGLAFGMIFLGIILTIVFLVSITSCKPSTMPKDFEISFQKLKSSGDSTI